jgi:hypothetical protein
MVERLAQALECARAGWKEFLMGNHLELMLVELLAALTVELSVYLKVLE